MNDHWALPFGMELTRGRNHIALLVKDGLMLQLVKLIPSSPLVAWTHQRNGDAHYRTFSILRLELGVIYR